MVSTIELVYRPKLTSLILESGADVISALADREACYLDEKKLFSCLVDLLSFEKITFNGSYDFYYLMNCTYISVQELVLENRLLDCNIANIQT